MDDKKGTEWLIGLSQIAKKKSDDCRAEGFKPNADIETMKKAVDLDRLFDKINEVIKAVNRGDFK